MSSVCGSNDEDRGAAFAPSDGTCSILLLAIWFGLAAGLLELLSLVIRVTAFENGFFLRSAHFVWMVPLSDLTIFAACGGLLAIRLTWTPRLGARWVVGVFIFLACASQLLLVRGLHSLTSALVGWGVAFRAAPWIVAHSARFRRLVRVSFPVLAVIVAILGAGAVARDVALRLRAQPRVPLAADRVPSALLIVLDTVRADHLSLYGYERNTSPNLARLATEGVRFDHAWATAPWTLPSHASLFTGRWPHELSVEERGWLDAQWPTLAEFLAARGFNTAGFVANQFFCGHESGLSRGFDTYLDYPVTVSEVIRASSLGWLLAQATSRVRDELRWFLAPNAAPGLGLDFSRKDASAVNREFFGWLARNDQGPFFAFLNYFDAHDPYLTPPGFNHRFGPASKTRAEFAVLRDWQKMARESLDSSSLSLARDAYDDCIASLDQALGELIDELQRQGKLDNTMLIVTADHGEQFGEHGKFRHGASLYEPEIHVPLLVRFPSRAPRGVVIAKPVSLRDVASTIVQLLGWQSESPFPGSPLSRTWASPPADDRCSGPPPRSELCSGSDETHDPDRSPGGEGPLTAIRLGAHVYIRQRAGGEELYDLDVDPTESRDLSGCEDSRAILERCRRFFDRSFDTSQVAR